MLTGAAAAAAEAADERFVLEFQVAGGAWQREPLASCGGARFEEAFPVRPFRFEKGLRSFAGWWYFATTETHVGFESWLERHLMLMDFDPDVLAVSSQPFWLRWRDGDGRSRRHVPDFFARKADGYVPVALGPDDYTELLPVSWRAVNAYGIKLSRRSYDSEQLNPLRLQPSGVREKKNLHEVRHDPYDISRFHGRCRAGR